MKPTLLIIAAGMGSRYGGLKQIDSVGPDGELIIDYSIYDALKAGFGKLVFVIRHYFEEAFKDKFGSKFDGIVETAYAYQELDDCLDGFKLPPDRQKPWGTGHAMLVAENVIDEPFAVINADDYYGPNSIKAIAEYLSGIKRSGYGNYSMIGYILRNTLSDYGYVSRGVCKVGTQMLLKSVVERKKVEKTGNGAKYYDERGKEFYLTGDEIVSMNLWGFDPTIFSHLQQQFRDFLNRHGNDSKAEFFIPTAVDYLIKDKKVQVKVLPTQDSWFGITYRQDRIVAAKNIRKLIEEGLYPEKLWPE